MRLALLLGLLLAGCVAAPPAAEEPAAADEVAPAAAPPVENEPPPPPEPEAAPSPAPDEAPPAPEPRVVVLEASARVIAAVGAPCTGSVWPCSRGPLATAAFDVPPGATHATLVATWDAAQPLATRAVVRLHTTEVPPVAEAEGESPLVLVVPPEALGGDLEVVFEPAVGGAMADTTATLVLTLTVA